MRKYIYTLKSAVLNKVVENYIDYIVNPYHEWRQFANPSVHGGIDYNDGEGIKAMPLRQATACREALWNLPKPRKDKAEADVIAIVDILRRRSLRGENEDGFFTVSSSHLKKIANNYNYILTTLRRMGIISECPQHYEGLYHSTLYRINDESLFHLRRTDTLNRKALVTVEKCDELNDKRHREKLAEAVKATSPQFVERYNANLAKLTIDKEAATAYVEERYSSAGDTLRRNSRLYVISKVIGVDYDKSIRAIDSNGRIYHIGTELQRDLKQFTNIAFSADCKNSHPFLLTYLLLKHRAAGGVSIEEQFSEQSFHTLLWHVISHLRENNGQYNHLLFSDFFCKSLENKRLSKTERAKTMKMVEALESVPGDVWRYIFDVSMGRIWDMFVRAFSEDRSTVKQKVFKSVIYSYPTKRKRKQKVEDAKWVEMFSTLYPTVYESINEIKQSLHDECREKGMTTRLKHPHTIYVNDHRIVYTDKDDVLLPLMLMRLESKIFTKILTILFNKRVVCFGIHDAVAVIRSKLTEDEIKQVMMTVYGQFGLIPTLSVDHYSSSPNGLCGTCDQ